MITFTLHLYYRNRYKSDFLVALNGDCDEVFEIYFKENLGYNLSY